MRTCRTASPSRAWCTCCPSRGFTSASSAAGSLLAARLAGLRRDPAVIVAAVVSAAYVGFIGWPAPAARAAALAIVLARCRVRQRHVRSDELLAATCLIVLLVDPWAVLDLGGWLSGAALWGATRFSRWTDDALGHGFGWRTLGASVGATLATAPITAWALGTVAPIGVVLNFAAIPLAAVAVPGVLMSLLLQPLVPPLARPFAAGAGLRCTRSSWWRPPAPRCPGATRCSSPPIRRRLLPWVLALFCRSLGDGPVHHGGRVRPAHRMGGDRRPLGRARACAPARRD